MTSRADFGNTQASPSCGFINPLTLVRSIYLIGHRSPGKWAIRPIHDSGACADGRSMVEQEGPADPNSRPRDVTLSEAARLTGRSEAELRALVFLGHIKASGSETRGAPLLVGTDELSRAGLLPTARRARSSR